MSTFLDDPLFVFNKILTKLLYTINVLSIDLLTDLLWIEDFYVVNSINIYLHILLYFYYLLIIYYLRYLSILLNILYYCMIFSLTDLSLLQQQMNESHVAFFTLLAGCKSSKISWQFRDCFWFFFECIAMLTALSRPPQSTHLQLPI